MKKIINIQIMKHLESENIIINEQFGFRPFYRGAITSNN